MKRKEKSPAITETQVRRRVIKKLIPHGWLVIDTSQHKETYARIVDETGSELGGLTDLICVRFDEVVFMETKKPGGSIRDSQIAFKAKIGKHLGNHVYHVFVDDPALVPQWMLRPPRPRRI